MKNKVISWMFFIFYTVIIIVSSILIVNKIDSEYSNYMYDISARVMLGTDNNIETQANIINKLYDENLSSDEIENGKEILKKYGIENTKDIKHKNDISGRSSSISLNDGLSDLLSAPQKVFNRKIAITICSILGLLELIIIIAFLIYNKKQKEKWSNLYKYCMDVLNGAKAIELTDENEGLEGQVKDSIYDVTILLKKANEELEKNNKETQKLIADISHQIKTPLTSLNMINDILYDGSIPEEKKKEFLDNMHYELDKIYWLVKTLLDISKLDSKTIVLKKSKINLYDMILSIKEQFKVMLDSSNTEFKINIDKKATILCDEKWTKEAIDNLVKNAIEHGAKQITVNGTYNKLYTHLEIIDNGDGIDESDINHIFERFYKAKNSRSESLGLGLAFTKSIIKNQDGIIKVISNKGEGTKFIIEM